MMTHLPKLVDNKTTIWCFESFNTQKNIKFSNSMKIKQLKIGRQRIYSDPKIFKKKKQNKGGDRPNMKLCTQK